MDPAAWGFAWLNWRLFFSFLNIIFINIVLSGDNALIIAMAVRSLPRQQRRQGLVLGSGVAVIVQVVITFFATRLLNVPFIKLAGGLLIIWIAIKLFLQGASAQSDDRQPQTLVQAIWIILVANLTTSTDNVLAVAGASNGSIYLLIFSLGLSIPIIIFSANLLSMLMDRYPIIIYVGAAVLGRVAADMIFSDAAIVRWYQPSIWFSSAVQVLFALGVIIVGKIWVHVLFRKAAASRAVD